VIPKFTVNFGVNLKTRVLGLSCGIIA